MSAGTHKPQKQATLKNRIFQRLSFAYAFVIQQRERDSPKSWNLLFSLVLVSVRMVIPPMSHFLGGCLDPGLRKKFSVRRTQSDKRLLPLQFSACQLPLKRESGFFSNHDCKRRGPKKHINFFNINFLAPTQNTPFGVPRKKKVYVPHFLGKDAKQCSHINFFGGIFGFKKGVPNGPFSATKSLVYCFYPALKENRLESFAGVWNNF